MAHTPVQPIWLWEYIHDELEEREWTVERLAVEMGDEPSVNLLALNFLQAQPDSPLDHNIQRLELGRTMAEGLSKALGVETETWLRLDESCRLSVAAQLERERES